MERDDPLVIYRNSKSRYTATGRVGPMAHTEYVRDQYWDGGPALDIYAIENYDDSIDVDPETINRVLGYKDSFRPQGFWRVSDDRPIERVARKFNI
ncbi:hypothetical protein C463_11436 [Halorubrum californiense DSM 19288]|uniref:Uncharacterized protein n=2 Tax=Haloferacaceae TaxID=1644056 RepID=M0E6R0_9EURY|nr:hypothetical protein C463_11436 [Halorubrum californiense DSM 19288]